MNRPVEIQEIDVEDIHVASRLRHSSEERIAALAESMREIGLMTPVSIRVAEKLEIDGKEVWSVPVLVAGATRLAAAKSLSWEKIACQIIDGDEIDAQLWEIDENLARSELTTQERRQHLRRRKDLWDRRRNETGGKSFPTSLSDGRRGGPQHRQSFAAETAAATGLSKRRINQLLAEPKPPAAKPVKIAREPLNEFEVVQHQVDALMSAWNKASPDAREQFLARVDRPVFDKTGAGRAA